MFKDLPEGQTHSMAERYTVSDVRANIPFQYGVMNENGLNIAVCFLKEDAEFLVKAANAYAALEQVKSIGEANKEKDA